MTIKLISALAASSLLLFSSCIREEALSPECDITSVSQEWLNSKGAGLILGTPVIKQATPASITLFINKKDNRIKALNPQFTISAGATLLYKDGNTRVPFDSAAYHDFSEPRTYSVRSADGHFTKDYVVSFEVPQPLDSCDFEDFAYNNNRHQYMTLLQRQEDGSVNSNIWSSGNAGYNLTGMAASPTDFPTSFVSGGHKGLAAKLVTRSTGTFGMLTRPPMPIAAGNLFIGTFNLNKAMLAPLEATRFGLQIVKGEPLKLSGWYKYKAGAEFTDRNKTVDAPRRDTADIYAVLFEVDPDNFQSLNGANVLSSERIVSIARIANPGEPSTWTYFEEPFRPMNGKTFDMARLKRNGYAISIVMTSSRQGAFFEGAVGSTLWVDDIKVTYK